MDESFSHVKKSSQSFNRGAFSSAQSLSRVKLFATPWTGAYQASLSITNFWGYSNSHPLSQWCHPTISFSVIPFASGLQFVPASGSFPKIQFFASGSQSIGVLASASVLSITFRLISFRMDWLDLRAVQGTLKSLLQHHSSKASFFTAQVSL